MPPTSTFPGHQLTCLRIIHVLDADEPERAEQEDEEDERREPPAVDDLAVKLAADGRDDGEHPDQGIGVSRTPLQPVRA